MQAVNDKQPIQNETSDYPLTLSVEWIAYLIVIAFVILMRFVAIGSVPMTDAEAIRALPAYHAVHASAPGNPQEASSVVVFWLQQISFTFFGASEFSARIPGAIGGIILTLMPLILRERIGRETAFLLSLILAFSPIAFTSARFADPTIWTLIFTIGLLWAVWRFLETNSLENALTMAGFLTATVLLSGSSGIVILFTLLLAGLLTTAWTVYTAPDELDSPGDDILLQLRDRISGIPLIPVLVFIAGLTIVASTGFLVDRSGLNIVAEALGDGFTGFVKPVPGAPNIFAIFSLVIYEPVLVVLSVVSVFMMLGSRSDSLIDRFVMSWLVAGFAILLIYRASTPAQALILVVPLAYLTARLISQLLMNYMPAFLSLESYTSNNPNDYIWIKLTVALVMFAGLVMMSLYLATLGRALLTYSGNFTTSDQTTILLYARLAWFFIMAVLIIVMYFLFASIWGNRNVLQGYGLGTFAFMLLMGLGTGWNTSVVNVSNPAELWYLTGIAPDAALLREALFDVSRRDTRGFPAINLVVLRDEESGVTGDGLIAWMIRDFDNARFVDSMADVRQEEIMLLPVMEEDPDLGGSYVGQSFTIREYPAQGQLSLRDMISWYTHRKTAPYTLPADVTVLWLRIDVYDGIPANQRP